MKSVCVPSELTEAPFYHRALKVNGFSAVESCTLTQRSQGTMFLEEHMLLYVIQGQNTVTHGKVSYTIRKNQMLLLGKASLIQFDKVGDPDTNHTYDSILFFFKDEFLQDFIRMADIKNITSKETVRAEVKTVGERMQTFFQSVVPYFNEPNNVDAGLLKIKMLELLYNISATDKNLLQQLLQMKKPVKTDLAEVVEANFANPVSIEQLAYLSGRSLAGFKRDFSTMYNMAPSEWIRIKRLHKAKETLENTTLPILDICYMMGFENPSHFSRIFKAQFGITPSSLRQVDPS
ncbi:MAG: AraC family transcriptional regulator [Chitinophagaceae bacterium]